jgi:putative hydrolase of the HAD superfamily
MSQTKKVILWDFDGTLATMPGLFRAAMVDVLNECEPGHLVDPVQIEPYLKAGFPWHKPHEPHLHLTTADAWWSALEAVFTRAYKGVGFRSNRADQLAKQVRKQVIDPHRYVIYSDTIAALEILKEKGWSHVILSNHIPELPDIVDALGLSPYLDCCITSARTGYEKPHPEAFRFAISEAGNPEKVWMIGDDVKADIRGADALGIPAILVHMAITDKAKYHALNLLEAAKIVLDNS